MPVKFVKVCQSCVTVSNECTKLCHISVTVSSIFAQSVQNFVNVVKSVQNDRHICQKSVKVAMLQFVNLRHNLSKLCDCDEICKFFRKVHRWCAIVKGVQNARHICQNCVKVAVLQFVNFSKSVQNWSKLCGCVEICKFFLKVHKLCATPL